MAGAALRSAGINRKRSDAAAAVTVHESKARVVAAVALQIAISLGDAAR